MRHPATVQYWNWIERAATTWLTSDTRRKPLVAQNRGLMHITKNDIPTKIDVPGAVARQAIDFGDASEYGALAAEYFSLGAGTDIAPLLKGLDDDACHAPHWGFLVSGEVVITYTDGRPTRPASATTSSTGRPATACAS